MMMRYFTEEKGRNINLLFVSLALGFGVAGVILARELILWPFVPIYQYLARTLPQHAGLRRASEIAFLATGGFYAGCVFALLRLCARTHFAVRFQRSSARAMIYALPLVSWLLIRQDYPTLFTLLLLIETVLGISIVLYLFRKLARISWPLVFLIVTHYTFWIWLFWRKMPIAPAILIPGFSGLAWLVWLYREWAGQRSTEPAGITIP